MATLKRVRQAWHALWTEGPTAAIGVIALGDELYHATRYLRFVEPLMTGDVQTAGFKSPDRYFSHVSDVYAHLPNLYHMTVDRSFRNVLELGTRTGESTVVFLAAVRETSGHLTSIDISSCTEARRRVEAEGLAQYWTFIRADDLTVDWKEPIDHLFIDTSHKYTHTRMELEKFEPHVRPHGVITLHDTTSHIEVWQAISDYFEERKDVRVRRYLHNNGLAVIEKFA